MISRGVSGCQIWLKIKEAILKTLENSGALSDEMGRMRS
jgi:hypothetical protein